MMPLKISKPNYKRWILTLMQLESRVKMRQVVSQKGRKAQFKLVALKFKAPKGGVQIGEKLGS
jgi:hypothetical protein